MSTDSETTIQKHRKHSFILTDIFFTNNHSSGLPAVKCIFFPLEADKKVDEKAAASKVPKIEAGFGCEGSKRKRLLEVAEDFLGRWILAFGC